MLYRQFFIGFTSLLFFTIGGTAKAGSDRVGCEARGLLKCIADSNSPVLPNDQPAIARKKEDEARTFIIITAVNDLGEFKKLVEQAELLKAYGSVQVNIGTLADKSFYEMPKGGNPWNEYASNNAPLYKFFPDAKIVPFVPAEFIKKNRQLLIDKAKILKENGMQAAFFANEPGFLPAAFFDAYPQLRGPRVDHPRRSNFTFFSPCVSMPETQEMYVNMMREMLTTIPEIKTFFFKTNDAGGGFCWSDWLYTGPNGPSQCKTETTAGRVKQLMVSLKEGAAKAGRDVNIYLTRDESNFSDEEKKDIDRKLPQGCYFIGENSPGIEMTGSFLATAYPVKGILDPMSFLKSSKAALRKSAKTFFISFKAAYNRGNELPAIAGSLLEMLGKEIQEPATEGPAEITNSLSKYCEAWAGKKSAPILLEAFTALDEAIKYKTVALPGVSALYLAVSNRFINRPLVFAPQRLTENEEAYFLPYVFNLSKEEARMDYCDLAGAHRVAASAAINNYVARIKTVYNKLESVDAGAPQKAMIRRMAMALRIYASIMRSCANFSEAQLIRDRNSAKLKENMHRPDKEPTWTGDADFIRFNELMRDELDNAWELIGLLDKGGMDLLCHANDAAHEDCFLLGPDLVQQLRQKRKIMLDHWRDIEGYLVSPFK